MRRRTTELLLLLAASPSVLLVFGLYAASRGGAVVLADFAVPASLLAAFLVAHLAVRKFAPQADPGLLPVVFALSGLGLAFVTRLDPKLAASQVMWIMIGVAALVATLVAVPSLERLASFKYTIMISGIVLLVLPAILGREINGAKLWLHFGGISFQPGEIAKVLIVLFLAAYLSENREMLSISTRRIAGMRLPEPRTLGPLLLMWLASLFVLVFERDLGSSLLLFGIFLVMIYTATGRWEYTFVGLVLFSAGAVVAWRLFTHVQTRVEIWLHPFADASGRGYQLVQSLFALAAGGMTGVGIGRGLPQRIPYVQTDFIFSAIAEELGLLGASAVVLLFLVLAIRGLATAARAKSDMAAFTAAGLVAGITVQAFVIVGGVSRLIPLTGVTLPFVSYGGSSLLSSFIALGLLLRAGDEATGTEAEMLTTVADLGVLGRIALGRRLVRVASVLALMLAGLVTNLTWIQVVEARSLANNPANTRRLAEELRMQRGSILTADGVVLAQSLPRGNGTFKRVYPRKDFSAHTVGYYSARYGHAGVEAAANDALTGKRSFGTFADAIDAASGRSVRGDDVVLTVDSRVQTAAEKALASRPGACVVLDPRTGAVLAMASNPGYDPNLVDSEWASLSTGANAALIDRARFALYPPGSTFKIVTLTGALASGVATTHTVYPGPATLDIGNAPVRNFEGGGYGNIDLVKATISSVNTVFAQLAVQLGAEKLVAQAKRFGFDQSTDFELPVKRSLMPDPAQMTTWETAWAGVGQPVGEHSSPAGPQATVLQMAMVASAIADRGVIMRPYCIDHVSDPTGTSTAKTVPRELRRATDAATAEQVSQVMVEVVKRGSGARAAIRGTTVAGKTGTAEVGKSTATNAWFIAFAPADNPRIAMAIMIEGGGVGGRVAAPAAKPVLEAALQATR
jgi:peptidoglycan glycosyltransferase